MGTDCLIVTVRPEIECKKSGAQVSEINDWMRDLSTNHNSKVFVFPFNILSCLQEDDKKLIEINIIYSFTFLNTVTCTDAKIMFTV